MVSGWLPPARQRQLAARIGRRNVAVDAGLTLEHLLAASPHVGWWLYGILRRLQRHQEHSDRIQHFVSISEPHAPLLVTQDLVRTECHWISAGDECCIAADIFRPAQAMRGAGIEIPAVFEDPQVGSFRAE